MHGVATYLTPLLFPLVSYYTTSWNFTSIVFGFVALCILFLIICTCNITFAGYVRIQCRETTEWFTISNKSTKAAKKEANTSKWMLKMSKCHILSEFCMSKWEAGKKIPCRCQSGYVVFVAFNQWLKVMFCSVASSVLTLDFLSSLLITHMCWLINPMK